MISSDSSPSGGDPVRLATFDRYRGLLFSIAYRMLGSVADAEDMTRGLLGSARGLPANIVIRTTRINGDPGIVSYLDGRPFSVLTLDIRDRRIRGVYIVTNTQKLAHLPPLAEAP